jgi:hypothetical protein
MTIAGGRSLGLVPAGGIRDMLTMRIRAARLIVGSPRTITVRMLMLAGVARGDGLRPVEGIRWLLESSKS